MKAGSSGGVEGIKGPDAATGLLQVCTESGIRCPRHVASFAPVPTMHGPAAGGSRQSSDAAAAGVVSGSSRRTPALWTVSRLRPLLCGGAGWCFEPSRQAAVVSSSRHAGYACARLGVLLALCGGACWVYRWDPAFVHTSCWLVSDVQLRRGWTCFGLAVC